MKTKTLVLAISALALPTLAFAEADGSKKGPGGDKNREHMLEKFDADGDGELSEAERETAKAARDAHREEILSKYDADGDGKLSKEERQTAEDAGEKLPPHGKKGGKKGGKKSSDE
ncbi:hypothetical protein [Rubritalea sp.]|uniref:hypothetical protein n=1 Tax=Rubritalea sp. TaxID=2109375 RepID=UPI003EF9F1FA